MSNSNSTNFTFLGGTYYGLQDGTIHKLNKIVSFEFQDDIYYGVYNGNVYKLNLDLSNFTFKAGVYYALQNGDINRLVRLNNEQQFALLSTQQSQELQTGLDSIQYFTRGKMKTKILTTPIINKLKEIAINNNINEDVIVTQRKFNALRTLVNSYNMGLANSIKMPTADFNLENKIKTSDIVIYKASSTIQLADLNINEGFYVPLKEDEIVHFDFSKNTNALNDANIITFTRIFTNLQEERYKITANDWSNVTINIKNNGYNFGLTNGIPYDSSYLVSEDAIEIVIGDVRRIIFIDSIGDGGVVNIFNMECHKNNLTVSDTYNMEVALDSIETIYSSSNITINNDSTTTIKKSYKLNIDGVCDELFRKSSTIVHKSNNTTINSKYSKYIYSDSTEQFGSSTITSDTNITENHGKFSITSSHSNKPDISLSTLGGMCLTANSDVSKNNNINFTTRVGIKNKISYAPQIINTEIIGLNNISEYVNTTSHYNLIPKTVNIIYINSNATLTSMINNNKNIYIRVNLPDGYYNGQIIKIVLHPEFEQTFNMSDRIAYGLKTNVVIRINNFCDTNDNEYVTVDLLLNRGGMGLSLIYIDNDDSDNTDGYWMLMNNSFSYA
tara:strand:- start:5385 stop:7226 length:1842 start_codon:yes stop_codon:yes gene_type:complete